MIESATCNATDLAARPKTKRPTVNVRTEPITVDADQVIHTAYVTTDGKQLCS
jgi:hypothetical protein